jgi:hypothetical protein
MRPALDPAGHRVPRTKPTCLLHTWRPHRRRPFALVLHLHQHQSSHNLHLQYLAKNQSTQRCQSLITQGSDHPPVLEPHMVLNSLPPLRRISPRDSINKIKVVPPIMTRGYKGRKTSLLHFPLSGIQMEQKVQGAFPTPSSSFMRKRAMNVHMDS